jgi:hypothetical protein
MKHEVPITTEELKEQFDWKQAQFEAAHDCFLDATRLWLAAILRRRMYEHSREDSDYLKECVSLLHGPLIAWCEADVA